MEERHMRMIVGTGGGKPGKKTTIYKMSIPIPWARAMGVTKEDSQCIMSFDGKAIVITKGRKKKENERHLPR